MIDDDAPSGVSICEAYIRYLILNGAIPLNDYILIKYPMMFIYLPWSK